MTLKLTSLTSWRLLIIIICSINISSCLVATGSMSYTDAKYLQRTFVSYDKTPDCSIDVFSGKSLPKEDFYVIGTCKLEKKEVHPKRKQNNIQWLQSCACLAEGDAIIIGYFLEEPEKKIPILTPTETPPISGNIPIPTSIPGVSISVGVPGTGNGAGNAGTIIQDALAAKVIKYGIEDRVY